jgi:hypothetical protein
VKTGGILFLWLFAIIGFVSTMGLVFGEPQKPEIRLIHNDMPCRLPDDEGEQLVVTMQRLATGGLVAKCEYEPANVFGKPVANVATRR